MYKMKLIILIQEHLFRRTVGKGKGKAVPLQARSVPEGSRKLRFPDFMKTPQDGGKVVCRKQRTPLPPGNTPGTHFCWRLSRPQDHRTGRIMSLKISVTTSVIEPATCQFVSQCLNHYATAHPKTGGKPLNSYTRSQVLFPERLRRICSECIETDAEFPPL